MLKKTLRDLLPPVVGRWLHDLRGRHLRYLDCPTDWALASKRSSGYDQPDILERVATATREVIAGRAHFERDSVLFHRPEFRFPVVAALLHVASLNGGRLSVVDFGGALGSAYWQSRPLLSGLQTVDWRVVEQSHYVERGRREFTTDQLSFHDTIADAAGTLGHGLALIGGALQFLESPKELLQCLAATQLSHLLIDRTPISQALDDRLCIQRTPKEIYPATYPSWIFSEARLLERLRPHWRVLADVGCDEGPCRTSGGFEFEFRGLYLERAR